jgi:DNA-binding CsgD family transcriptional regulator/tetratricopeptide (TPR) repeat protein
VSLGDVDAGLRHLERALDLARHGAIDARIVAYHNLAFALEQSDRLELGLLQATEAIQVLRESGLERRFGTRLRAVAGECLFRLGRWDEADTITREGLELRAPPDRARYLLGVRGELLVARGDVDEARRLLTVAGGAITGDVDPDLQAFVAARQAELALHDRRWQDAREAVTRGLRALGDGGIVSLTALLYALGIRVEAERFGEASVRRDPSEADRAREHAERLRQQMPEPASAVEPDGDRAARAWRATAHAEMSVFDGTADAASWEAVAAAWDGIPSPYPAAYARSREAAALLATGGDRTAAGASLHRAWQAARALGARPLLSAIEGLAQRARIPPPTLGVAAAASPPISRVAAQSEADTGTRLGLSVREIEVLRLLALGRTNGQIALELFISPKTASVHVTHILVKLGVTNRVEAAMIAARSGLADQGDRLAGS